MLYLNKVKNISFDLSWFSQGTSSAFLLQMKIQVQYKYKGFIFITYIASMKLEDWVII